MNQFRPFLFCGLLFLTVVVVERQCNADDSIHLSNERFELLTTAVDFAEGPAAGNDGAIYFSDIPTGKKPGRILKFDPATERISVFRKDSGKSNGLFVDAQGRLVACEGADFGGRRVSRSRGKGPAKTIVDNFEGKRFRAPNDLCVDRSGRIWFTDPHYLGDEPLEIDQKSVYRINSDGSINRVITQPLIQKPNGINISPDNKTLYVADTNNESGPDGKPGNMQLTAYTINADGSVSNKRIIANFAPEAGVDGMTLDTNGNIYAAVRSQSAYGVRVYSPDGEEIARIQTPGKPTNCIFGRGMESTRLYITLDNGFGRIRLKAKGYHLPKE